MSTSKIQSTIASALSNLPQSLAKRRAFATGGTAATSATPRQRADTVVLSREAIAQSRAEFLSKAQSQKIAAIKGDAAKLESLKNDAAASTSTATSRVTTDRAAGPAAVTAASATTTSATTAPTAAASSTRPDVSTTGAATIETPVTTQPAPASNSAPINQSTIDLIGQLFGRSSGDEGFSSDADVDGNGVINFADQTAALANWGQTRETTTPPQPRVYDQSVIDAIQTAFGARLGDENYSLDADADGNGVVNFTDQTYVRANWGLARD
jgi:hypothetical protein